MIQAWIKSILSHAVLISVLYWAISHPSVWIQGQEGKNGSPPPSGESLVVWTDPIEATDSIDLNGPSLTGQLPIPQPTPIPEETSISKQSIEENQPQKTTDFPGEKGQSGQGGNAPSWAQQVGTANRSNALGLYISKVQRKVQSHLRSPGSLIVNHQAQVRATIQKTGNVEKIALIRSTGNSKLDSIALDAVKKSIPFDPFEQELTIVIPVIFRSR